MQKLGQSEKSICNLQMDLQRQQQNPFPIDRLWAHLGK